VINNHTRGDDYTPSHEATTPKVFSSDSNMALPLVLSLVDSVHCAVTVHEQVATAHEESFFVSHVQDNISSCESARVSCK